MRSICNISLLAYCLTEIREFPKAVTIEELGDLVLQGLRNCINLQVCTWTRDGSLSSDILTSIQASESLRELEINGRSEGSYDPELLLGFARLSRIALIMPSSPVINRLKPWTAVTGGTLQSLTLICQVVTILRY